MRIIVGPNRSSYGRKLKHDDVVIVPQFFCDENDWSLYYKLVEEMREEQAAGTDKSEWISWHEGAHLITNNPKGTLGLVPAKDVAHPPSDCLPCFFFFDRVEDVPNDTGQDQRVL